MPSEVGSSLVKNAVGILTFEDKVFCTGLRVSQNEVITAKHCFVDARSGQRTPDAQAVINGSGKIWFAFEGEPNNRFGLCSASLPPPIPNGLYAPDEDFVRLRIARTTAAVPNIVASNSPIANGTSLYLRGYFPFTDSNLASLDRMRATKVAGCVAHSPAGACFFHACQTTPIMSGAPIFVRPEPGHVPAKLVLAGMHLGGARLSDPNGPYGAVCKGADGTKVPSSNFGYQFK